MRKGIIYLLMSIFLLFVAENSHSFDIQTDYNNQSVLLHLFSFSKKYHLNHSAEKNVTKHIADSVDFAEETGCSLINLYTLATAISFAGLAYIFQLTKTENLIRYKHHVFIAAVKRFILLRSIRI